MTLPASGPLDVPPKTEQGVLVRRQGAIGRITLDRPRALNALNSEMVATIRSGLAEFEAAPSVALVMIDSTSPRAFCAGGDIEPIWQMVKAGNIETARAHCRMEYDLDLAIARFAKPVVTLIDGLVMGGGIGISCHTRHSVITERARLSLPETSIGFVPDSGINAFLAECPGRLGPYLALTGRQIGPGDMYFAGFGRHFVQSGCLPALIDILALSGNPAVISKFETSPPTAQIITDSDAIDAIFAGADLASILAALDGSPAPSWQSDAARRIRRNSPTACQAALDLLFRIQPGEPLEQIITKEFAAVSTIFAHPDFLEGVRANVIERDRKPKWI